MLAGMVVWSARWISHALVRPDATHGRALLALGTVVLAPLVEETLYRGVLYRHLRDRLNWLPSVLISAAIFALMHSSVQMPGAYLGGLAYALLREWRGSLVAPITAHASLNLLSMAAAGTLS